MQDDNDITPEKRAHYADVMQLLQLLPDEPISIEWLAHRLGWDRQYVNELLQELTCLGYVSDASVAEDVKRRTQMEDDMNAETRLEDYMRQVYEHTPGQMIAAMACSGYSAQKMGDEPPTMEGFQNVFDRYIPQFVEYCDEPDIVAKLCHIPFGEHQRLGKEIAVTDTPICKYPSFVMSQWQKDENWSDEGDDQKESPEG